MNGVIGWDYDPITKKRHHPNCRIWSLSTPNSCTCVEQEDEMVEVFTRTPVKGATLSGQPTGPSTLADLIRAARRAGHLRPLQPYGGGRTTAATP